MLFGMNRKKQKKDSMMFVAVGYLLMVVFIIGITIGKII